ncbi:MAG: hypothetical protein JSS27_18610 [Planctomycetes bacterium]|nr:hypothetical protein [Planctomycetota bacterium]
MPLPQRRNLRLVALLLPAFAWGVWNSLPSVGRGDPASAAAEAMFRQLDSSGDGTLTLDEATPGSRSFLERVFKDLGRGPSDKVTRDEFLAAYERLRGKPASTAPKVSAGGASTGDGKPAGDEPPPEGIRFIDADGDGLITRAEWSRFTQTFARLDADKDNSLAPRELEATGGAADLIMKLADANGDSRVSRVEWGKMVQSFVRLDTNKDHALELSELQGAAETLVASASGSASLGASGKGAKPTGPTVWRGTIEGRGQIELTVNGYTIIGREYGPGGRGQSLGAGTFTMTGNGKSGNMDAVYTEGDRRGQACLGIYQMQGNQLLWCVNNKGSRPDSMNGGRGNWLLTLTRVDEVALPGRSL